MSTSAAHALFRCDGASVPQNLSRLTWSHDHSLASAGPDRNLAFAGINETPSAASELTGRAHDLVSIAAYAYIADQMVSRGGEADAHHEAWRRMMALCVPVSDPDFWNQDVVHVALQQALQFAAEDSWTFGFSGRSRPATQQMPLLDEDGVAFTRPQPANQVLLLSGGADSLCAAIQSVQAGHRPHLVSHRPSPLHDSRQRMVSETIGHRFGLGKLSRTSFPIHRIGWEARETSQRSRAFLFASLGASMASEVQAPEVVLADNGIVSIGLPLHKGLPGALMSRTTHPGFHERFNELLALVLPSVRIVNPLLGYTRHRTLALLEQAGCPDLLKLTNSCSRARTTGGKARHCGYCSQCVDRRFGVIRAGLEQHEQPDPYVLDVFTGNLDNYEKRSMPLSYVARAKKIDGLSDDELFAEFPQLFDCLPQDPRQSRAASAQLLTLVREYSADIECVMQTMTTRHSIGLYHDPGDGPGAVAQNSLLRLVLGTPSQPHSLPAAPTPKPVAIVARTPARMGEMLRRFRRQGDVWDLIFDGRESYVKHREGMQYIAYLLGNSGQDVSAVELRLRFGGSEATAFSNPVSVEDARSAGLSRPGQVADLKVGAETKTDLKRRIERIAEERAEADLLNDESKLAALDDELERIGKYWAEGHEVGGRARPFSAEEERARDAVRAAISRCIGQIRRGHPGLGLHLKQMLRLGFKCSYSPGLPLTWDTAPWASEAGQNLSGSDRNSPEPDSKRPA